MECGLLIGGQNHVLTAHNVKDESVDKTEKGHTLGTARKLNTITTSERKLNRASFGILRLLTHLSMYAGANENPEAVCRSITPSIKQEDLSVYILDHIELDMTSLQNILGKSRDDILLLMHHILAQIMKGHSAEVIGESYTVDKCKLLTKEARLEWEEEFAKRYIVPCINKVDAILKNCMGHILNDQRLGTDPLQQMLYETDKPQKMQNILALHDIPSVWRYRELITINHLRQKLDLSKLELSVLKHFLDEEHHLRAIRFVPSIMRLQKMLIQMYSRKLDRDEAKTLTIEKVKEQMRQDRNNAEFFQLLQDFIEAWDCVRHSNGFHEYVAKNTIAVVDKNYFVLEITDKTPVSYLIPTYRGAGLCSYFLLLFLLDKQNAFLQNCCDQGRIRKENLPQVHVKDISSAHLISYHPDRDLLPMVLANCNYSFEVGQGTRVEYNFTNLERQLMDRFLFSKSMINGLNEVETIQYRSESTNATVFQTLYRKVKQVRIRKAVQHQICEELHLKTLADLCEGLDQLAVAISYLKTVGSDPNKSLHKFMADTLKMENPLGSPKAQQACKCKHAMSLWITMALERAKQLAGYDKVAFEWISETFKQPLAEDQKSAIKTALVDLSTEQIDTFSELVFECIVLWIDIPQNNDDMAKISLCDLLKGYLYDCPYKEKLISDDKILTALDQLTSDRNNPACILTEQSVEVWTYVNLLYTDKHQK